MEQHFWRQFALGFFIINSICVIILLEFFIFGKPFISFFLLIFGAMYVLNAKLFGKHHTRHPRAGGDPV